ncbi:MAG TPA: hypothetical protein VHW09_21205 [Bryobacteraceae bacterium]|jgi:hypothetical protein|nr:hypothetical protein [Bryobacteraceae bacterium]
MATMPEFLTEETFASAHAHEDRRPERDPFQLRTLPFEDVYFRPKKMDNSKLVREADPRAGGACWSVIGVAALMLAFGGGVLAPHVANTVAGYKLESLRAESQQLADERRTIELQEAELLSPERLDRLAQDRRLVTPSASQVVHLENQGESKVAMVRR